MHEMMSQEPDRFLTIRISSRSPLDGPGQARDDLGGIEKAAAAVPVDGVDMGVDL